VVATSNDKKENSVAIGAKIRRYLFIFPENTSNSR
jgi:hypothetical protein